MATRQTSGNERCLRWVLSGSAAVRLAARVKRSVALRRQEIQLDTDAKVALARLRETLGGGPDVIAAEDQQVVRRFAGSAGPFRYATIELLTFDDGGISFEHLQGPFAACRECFDLLPAQPGALLVHSGSFSLRGGLWGWLLGIAVVRPAFDSHVREHMLELRAQFAAEPRSPA